MLASSIFTHSTSDKEITVQYYYQVPNQMIVLTTMTIMTRVGTRHDNTIQNLIQADDKPVAWMLCCQKLRVSTQTLFSFSLRLIRSFFNDAFVWRGGIGARTM
mmetsp:Transcript_22239/g.27279  ORF Transcript_22239/g.27279 Transcript_22239/m.27279 type:complete len:103 (+) Transcript_22239:538-846(+)